MPYIPGCRHDIFISYASENNADGWVEQFQALLGQELTALLGRDFVPKESIFFDKTFLQVAQSYPDELTQAAQESALLVPVLSPSYLTSVWCNKEQAKFFSRLPHGARGEHCLAPIVVRPFNKDDLNERFRNAEHLSFLSPDNLSPLPAGSPVWCAQIRLLSRQIAAALQNLRQLYKPVYVGKANDTQRGDDLRAWCRKEVEKRHFRTVPEGLQTLEDIGQITADLQEACLAVHFLGGADDTTIEAIEKSIEVCAGPTLIFQPHGTELNANEGVWLPEFEKQIPTGTARYQRINGKNDQELIGSIEDQLASSRPPVGADESLLQLALICDDLDLPSVRKLKADIMALGIKGVDLPNFLGTRLKSMERVRKWGEFLASGKALVFYHGAADRQRLEPIWMKAAENARAKRSWFLAPPDVDTKRSRDPEALWQIEQLLSLVEQAKSAGGGV